MGRKILVSDDFILNGVPHKNSIRINDSLTFKISWYTITCKT